MRRIFPPLFVLFLVIFSFSFPSASSRGGKRHRISLWRRSLSLSEVLRAFSRQTGLPFRLEREGTLPRLKFHFFVHSRGLREVMDALVFLLGVDRSLEARWVTEGKGYVLRVRGRRDFQGEWRHFLQALFEALPSLAEGHPVTISFNGLHVPANITGAERQWRFLAALSPPHKNYLLRRGVVTVPPSLLTREQRVVVEEIFLRRLFPTVPLERTTIVLRIQGYPRGYTPSLRFSLRFSVGRGGRAECSVTTPLVRDFEKAFFRYRRQNLLPSPLPLSRFLKASKGSWAPPLPFPDWLSLIGKRKGLRGKVIFNLPAQDYLEWVALSGRVSMIVEATRVKATFPLSSPSSFPEAIKVATDAYWLVCLPYSNDLLLFYNPFRGLP